MYTSEDLIASIKLRGVIPTSQQMYTDARICSIITEELLTNIVPWIMSFREDYYLTYYEQTIEDGVYSYDVPEQAIGGKLRAVWLLDGSGNIINSNPRLSLKEVADFGWLGISSNYWNGFYMEGNKVILYPQATNAEKIRLYYYRRPNTVVPTADAGQVQSIDTNNSSIVLSNVPAAWTTGTRLAVIKAKPGFDAVFEGTPIVSLSSPTVELASVEGISVGDWVSLEYYTPVIMCPVEAQTALSQCVVAKLLEGLGDSKWKSAQEKANELKAAMQNTLAPRVDDSPQICSSKNWDTWNGYNYFRGY